MFDFLHHLFLPKESNNHRPKILHHSSLLFLIISIFVFQFFLTAVKTNFPDVLGVSTNIKVEDLLSFTNQKRLQQGVNSLTLNQQLSKAALLKAKDMFAKGYWAHNAPEGTTPWFFIKKAQYNYIYAGENLAKGFNSSSEVVEAWMASPSHRENMLSENYQDIGFAVLAGKLKGEEGVLVVEMFGGKEVSPLAGQKTMPKTGVLPQKDSNVLNSGIIPAIDSNQPLFDFKLISKNISLTLLGLFIFILALDMIIVERKKITRLVGHNLDHIFFLTGILIIIILISRGVII